MNITNIPGVTQIKSNFKIIGKIDIEEKENWNKVEDEE